MIVYSSQPNPQGKKISYIYINSGCPSVFDCYLVLRSLKTLELRVKAHTKNAYTIARYLEKHEFVDKVITK
jgi:cystathionine beta-lyase/cystathionine gamma-synthase